MNKANTTIAIIAILAGIGVIYSELFYRWCCT